jgi:ATP-dependent HslUV protease ATP-binding subunit HslU
MGLTPARIVEELNRYIIGQFEAKKAVAIALRNRYRRKCLSSEMALEVVPKNILMIGPTGVGKTEVARRLARLAGAPFIKVEATKFTEVGYVGRDVESIIRDLVEMSVQTHKAKAKERVLKEVESLVIDRILDAIVGKHATEGSREKFASRILSGELDDTEIEIEVQENTSPMGGFEIPGMPGAAMGFLNIGEMIGKNFGSTRTKTRKLKVKQAKELIISEESEKLVDQEKVVEEAINSVENDGIVFLDEVDKLCSSSDRASTPSREGVQRDLLPLIEGTNVATRYGTVATDHILFIASGAFHLAKPSDLLPELQGRLPIRVELSPLTKEDLVRILVEPESSLIKQYVALIATEGIDLKFTDAAIDKIATYAMNFNSEIEDIGARRLHTVMEKLLEEISYNASDLNLENITVDIETVEERLSVAVKDQDLKRFIL